MDREQVVCLGDILLPGGEELKSLERQRWELSLVKDLKCQPEECACNSADSLLLSAICQWCIVGGDLEALGVGWLQTHRLSQT